MWVERLGPKHAKVIYEELNVTGLKEVEKAAREGKIRQIRGLALRPRKGSLTRFSDSTKRDWHASSFLRRSNWQCPYWST
jgi:hypothetical protein